MNQSLDFENGLEKGVEQSANALSGAKEFDLMHSDLSEEEKIYASFRTEYEKFFPFPDFVGDDGKYYFSAEDLMEANDRLRR